MASQLTPTVGIASKSALSLTPMVPTFRPNEPQYLLGTCQR